MGGALSGVRVLDLTTMIAGPLCARTLGDYGADVIKIEALAGDPARGTIPSRNPLMGALFLLLNRNKRPIALDLKKADATEVIRKLVATADVFIHNMRPDALKRAGLGYDALKAINPRLVYANIIGFGHGGRYHDRPAYDDIVQAMSGFASLFARSGHGPPRYMPLNGVDRLTGHTAAHAVLAALFHRERTGEGQAVEIPMYENMIEFLLGDHMTGALFDPPIGKMGSVRSVSPARRPFPTKDGAICLMPHVDKHWKEFFEITGHEQYIKDPRFATPVTRAQHAETTLEIVAQILESRTTADWLAAFSKSEIPHGPVQTLEDLLEDPHLKDVGFFAHHEHPTEGGLVVPKPPVWMSETLPSIRTHAMPLGSATREVLKEYGYSDGEIDALVAGGAAKLAG